MSINVKAGGLYRTVSQVHVKAGGLWRNCTSVWEKSGGVWRQVFSSGNPALSNHTLNGLSAQVNFRNDGTLNLIDDASVTTAGQWLTSSPGTVSSVAAGAWAVRFTYVSGPNPSTGTTNGGIVTKSGVAYGVWHSLDVTRSIMLTGITGLISGTYGGTLVVDAEVRLAGGVGSTLATGRFTLNIASS